MLYTDYQKAAFQREFASRRRRQITIGLGVVLLFVVLRVLVGQAAGGALWGVAEPVWTIVLIALVLGLIAFSLANWRCPACGKYLGKGISPRFCSRCGVELHRG